MKRMTFVVTALLACLLLFTGCDANDTLEGNGASADGPTEIWNVGIIGGADGPTQIILGDATSEVIPSDSIAPNEPPSSTSSTSAPDAASSEGDNMKNASDNPSGYEAPTPNPAYETMQVLGTVAEINTDRHICYIQQDKGVEASDNPAQNQIGAVLSDETILMNSQTGEKVDPDSIAVGQRVCAYVGLAMTRSIPPQAQCVALPTNLPANDIGIATYVRPIQVKYSEDGSVVLLNQNADLYITIPSNLEVEVFMSSDTVRADSVQSGNKLMVWFTGVAYSFPGQTTVTRAMLLP